jgi:hypothetical protein
MLNHIDRVGRLAQTERKVTVIVKPFSSEHNRSWEQADRDGSRSACESLYGAGMSPFQLSPVKGV